MNDTVILGIDPGSVRTGYGLISKNGNTLRHIENGIIAPDTDMAFKDRIAHIFTGILEVIDSYSPSVIGVEDIFVSVNARSALKLGHVKGAVMAAAALRDISLHEHTPAKVKKAVTGSGRAAKNQIGLMVVTLLQLPEPPQEDAADALAIAITQSFQM